MLHHLPDERTALEPLELVGEGVHDEAEIAELFKLCVREILFGPVGQRLVVASLDQQAVVDPV